MLSYLLVHFVGLETPKHNAFDQFWKFEFLFEHCPTHDFLVLTDPVIIFIYLKATNRQFGDQGNVLQPISKLLKRDLVQTLNTFQNPSLRSFAAGKASLVWFWKSLYTKLKRQNSWDLFKIPIIQIFFQKIATISPFTLSD